MLTGIDESPPPSAGRRRVRPLKGTVLVVDDEDLVRNAARALLQHLGAAVVEANDGQVAVELWRDDPARFSWVLMDLSMPRLDGCGAARRIRETTPDAKIVLTSGLPLDDGDAAVADAVLDKPFLARDLLEIARRIGVAPG